MNVTKSKAKILVKLLEELANQASRIRSALTDVEDSDDGLFDTLDEVTNGEIDAEEAWKEIEEYYEDDDPDDDDVYEVTEIDVDPNSLYVTLKQPVDGGKLVAGICSSDCGTFQTYSGYENAEGGYVDLTMAEVKRGLLAVANNMPEDNKDVEMYVWSDPATEDYTYNFRLEHNDLNVK